MDVDVITKKKKKKANIMFWNTSFIINYLTLEKLFKTQNKKQQGMPERKLTFFSLSD